MFPNSSFEHPFHCLCYFENITDNHLSLNSKFTFCAPDPTFLFQAILHLHLFKICFLTILSASFPSLPFNDFSILIIAMLLSVDQFHIPISSCANSGSTSFTAFLNSPFLFIYYSHCSQNIEMAPN